MNDESLQDNFDPLHDSEAQLRAKRAHERLSSVAEEGAAPAPVVTRERKTPHHFESSYQNSLFASAGSLGRPAWSDSMRGRAAIRAVSRGITGAFFFTAGARYARMQLADYDINQINRSKPLHWIAQGFDVVFGKPIASMTRGVSRLGGLSEAQSELNAWNSINFRTKSYMHGVDGKLTAGGLPTNARSLGVEMTSISFDFAMMSIGDAMTRNFIQMLDPNLKKTWWLNEQNHIAGVGEKRHFSGSKWLQSTGRAAWRIMSKSQGEDWAVALPYVYQMRMQRGLMTRWFRHDLKGSKIFFDNAWNGAAYKVNEAGQIIGDYNLAGAMDLHARFVGYNVYTLMFREGYDTISNNFKQWREGGYKLDFHLPEHPLQAFAHGVKDTTRYVIKSTIKGNMYMNPAVIPFWLMRVPSSKWRGGLIYAEAEKGTNAVASTMSFDERLKRRAAEAGVSEAEMADSMLVTKPDGTQIINYNTTRDRIEPHKPGTPPPEHMYFGNHRVDNPIAKLDNPYDSNVYEHYKPGVSTTFSKMLNPIGRFSYWLGGKATEVAEALPVGKFKNYIGMNEANPGISDAISRERFARTMIDASLAYTPYFYAKTEFGLRVDDTPSSGGRGKMDTAIYGLMDNIAGLKFRSAGQSIKQMWYLSTHVNRDPIMREGGVIKDDNTPPPPAPKTIVQAEGRTRHTPVELSREEAPPEKDTDRHWAQTVTHASLADKIVMPPSPTRH